jgi:hypothetical protein
VIPQPPPPPPECDGPPTIRPPDTFDTAIGDTARLATALGSAIAAVTFSDAARLRGELEHALSRAAVLVVLLAGDATQTAARRRLDDARAATNRLFRDAPTPSAAAVAAAESGDRTAWIREEQAWVADRLARGTNPSMPRLRRDRRDTSPETPKALRPDTPSTRDSASGQSQDASATPGALAGARAPDETGTR